MEEKAFHRILVFQKKEFWFRFLKKCCRNYLGLFISKSFSFSSCVLFTFTLKPGMRDFCSSHKIFMDFLYLESFHHFLRKNSWLFCHKRLYVLTCRFSDSVLLSSLLMFPEGFLVLVKIKMVWGWGIFLFWMYPV